MGHLTPRESDSLCPELPVEHRTHGRPSGQEYRLRLNRPTPNASRRCPPTFKILDRVQRSCSYSGNQRSDSFDRSARVPYTEGSRTIKKMDRFCDRVKFRFRLPGVILLIHRVDMLKAIVGQKTNPFTSQVRGSEIPSCRQGLSVRGLPEEIFPAQEDALYDRWSPVR
jgi:hypothetical protein